MDPYFLGLCLLLLTCILGHPGLLVSHSEGVMSKDVTSSINGFFIGVVFLSHLRGYIPKEMLLQSNSTLFISFIAYMSQLVVATFLFFSGYGIMESIRRKENYINNMPLKRILPFLLDVWIALIPFYVIRLFQHNIPKVSTMILALVGWAGIGNSTWYIFAILCMWIATYFAFRLFSHKDQEVYAVILVSLMAMLYGTVIKGEAEGTWWYDTILCYPAGMLFSLLLYRLRFNSEQADWRKLSFQLALLASLVILTFSFLQLHRICKVRALYFNIMAVLFGIMVSLASFYLRFSSKPLTWAGNHLFYGYIYQRVPMIVMRPLVAHLGVFLYTGLCLVATLALMAVMPLVHSRIKKWLFV